MDIILNILFVLLSILGGLGLFLYGMKLMSESLQKLTGKRMRRVINVLTRKKGRGFGTGLGLTALVQSSSATTVMTVSFVSTGLISMAASLPIVLGANLGTTLKFWLISYLGFSFDLSLILLAIIGIVFPLIFAKKSFYRSIGEFVFGFGILFLGIFFIKQLIPDLSSSTWIFEWVESISNMGFLSSILFVLFGMILTAVIQSSSAMMTLTLVLAYKGLIDYQAAIALILGENIGTTITANIAAWFAGINARRTAIFHTLFNVFSVSLALLFFYPLSNLILYLSENVFALNPINNAFDLPIVLSLFHTCFNLLAVLLAFPFLSLYVRLLNTWGKKIKEKRMNFRYISARMFSTPELALVQVSKQLRVFTDELKMSFSSLYSLLMVKKDKKYSVVKKTLKNNVLSYNAHYSEIREFLLQLSGNDLSSHSSYVFISMEEANNTLKNISALMSDMIETIESKNEQNVWFSQPMRDDLIDAFSLIELQFSLLKKWITYVENDDVKMHNLNNETDVFDAIRNHKQERMKDAEIPKLANVLFSQLIAQTESVSALLSNIIDSEMPLKKDNV